VVGDHALVSEWRLGRVLRVNLVTGAVSTYLGGLKNPLAVTALGDASVLVGDWGSGSVYRISGA